MIDKEALLWCLAHWFHERRRSLDDSPPDAELGTGGGWVMYDHACRRKAYEIGEKNGVWWGEVEKAIQTFEWEKEVCA